MMVKVMVIRGEKRKQQRCSHYPEEREWEEECGGKKVGTRSRVGGWQGGLRLKEVGWKECRGRMGGREGGRRYKE